MTALVITAGVLAALTACTGPAVSSACDTSVTAGNSSSAVKAPGSLGTAPEVAFPDPLIAKRVERTSIITGDGVTLRRGQPVLLEATILSGADGSVVQQTSYDPKGGSLFTIGDEALPELGDALECTTLGSRVAVVIPPADAAAEGQPTDSTVIVVDLIKAFKAKADGADQLPVPSMPAVVTAPDGTPGITVPNEDAPTEYRMERLKRGSGKVVGDEATVVAKYTAIDWNSKAVVESTWTTGSVKSLNPADPAVSEGVSRAMSGERVGSQLLVVLPPDLASTEAAPTDSTLVYVIDILGVID